ncbi:MAG: hypothetical protein HC767_01985 [Akkermansiaceae bacterium]|nr:hypothetical protein [Akkermansiaceae bacterium]
MVYAKIHFIAIGGAAMHNLAIDLHNRGFQITGSDDEIYEPSRTLLANKGLLPAEMGWFPEKITQDLDCVILGMHARVDNPELLKAQALGIKIYSYHHGSSYRQDHGRLHRVPHSRRCLEGSSATSG